ncbi:MAG TPA: ribosome maturation factor RimM [Actinomycetota bacterium]
MTPERGTDGLLAVGRVGKPHGLRGEVTVEPLTDTPDRFAPGATLRMESGELTVAASRPHQRRMLVLFEGVEDRNQAEGLRGTILFVPDEDLPDLPDDAYWPRDLVGCEVVTESGDRVGPISEVLRNPANDLWVTERGMIPAVREVVVEVDLEARRVVIRDVPGLLEEA